MNVVIEERKEDVDDWVENFLQKVFLDRKGGQTCKESGGGDRRNLGKDGKIHV